jgi:catechol 2,3-dioxygenase-like lactoylglutathione lyase family enzyme
MSIRCNRGRPVEIRPNEDFDWRKDPQRMFTPVGQVQAPRNRRPARAADIAMNQDQPHFDRERPAQQPPLAPGVESVSAVTLATRDRVRAIRFYTSLGFTLRYGGPSAPLASFAVGGCYLNLVPTPPGPDWHGWGRIIFHVRDVDAMYARALACGYRPSTQPRDAEWGERYFHLTDPDGHELSFAKPLPPK